MEEALAAAVGALVIALLDEMRARSRARAAADERQAHAEELRQIALQPDRRREPDEGGAA